MNKKGSERYITIDIAKGIAVFLVLWGHFIQYSSGGNYDHFADLIFRFIYSFHMPLFSLISGYLFYNYLEKRSLKQVICKKLEGLLWPVFFWSVMRYYLSFMFHIVKGEIIFEFTEWWELFTGSFLWFLWSILAASICVAIVVKKFPVRFKIIGFIVAYFVMYLFPNAEMNLFLYPYFIISYSAKKYEYLWKPHWKQGFIGASISFLAMLPFYQNKHYIYNSGISIDFWDPGGQILTDIYRYIIGFCGSIAFIGTIAVLEKRLNSIIVALLVDCGKLSLHIYIIQCFLLPLAWPKFLSIFLKEMDFQLLVKNVVLYHIGTFVVSLVLLFILLVVLGFLEKVKLLKIFFGR